MVRSHSAVAIGGLLGQVMHLLCHESPEVARGTAFQYRRNAGRTPSVALRRQLPRGGSLSEWCMTQCSTGRKRTAQQRHRPRLPLEGAVSGRRPMTEGARAAARPLIRKKSETASQKRQIPAQDFVHPHDFSFLGSLQQEKKKKQNTLGRLLKNGRNMP